MTLVCLASQKGSPGASAAALAIAAAFKPQPGRRKLLLEADIAGGVLGIRYRLPHEPGLITLAAAARSGVDDDDLWRHVVELPGGLPAVVSPDGSEPIHAALLAAGGHLGRYLANHPEVDVICDLGRLHPDSPAIELAAEANAVLMVARPTAEQLQPAARRLLSLRPRIGHVGWLLIGDQPYGPAQVEETFGLPVVGVLADDRRSVEAIEAGTMTRKIRRHPFVRSAVTIAEILGDWLAPVTTASVSAPDAAPEPLAEPADRVTPPTVPTAPAAPEIAPPTVTVPPTAAVPPAVALPPDVASAVGPVGSTAPPLAATLPPPPPPTVRRPPPASVEVAPPAAGSPGAVPDGAPSAEPPPAQPVAPQPPSPPTAPAGAADGRVRTPFVHDDDDVEWTGS